MKPSTIDVARSNATQIYRYSISQKPSTNAMIRRHPLIVKNIL
jgi:hypothetical protein